MKKEKRRQIKFWFPMTTILISWLIYYKLVIAAQKLTAINILSWHSRIVGNLISLRGAAKFETDFLVSSTVGICWEGFKSICHQNDLCFDMNEKMNVTYFLPTLFSLTRYSDYENFGKDVPHVSDIYSLYENKNAVKSNVLAYLFPWNNSKTANSILFQQSNMIETKSGTQKLLKRSGKKKNG